MTYGMLVDPLAEAEGAPRLELPGGISLDAAAEAIAALLDTDPRVERFVLVVGGEVAGATSRTYARTVLMAQPPRGPGDEVRAGTLGESTRFTVIAFRCAICGRCAYTAFYDDRFRPVCEIAGHGPMELRAGGEGNGRGGYGAGGAGGNGRRPDDAPGPAAAS